MCLRQPGRWLSLVQVACGKWYVMIPKQYHLLMNSQPKGTPSAPISVKLSCNFADMLWANLSLDISKAKDDTTFQELFTPFFDRSNDEEVHPCICLTSTSTGPSFAFWPRESKFIFHITTHKEVIWRKWSCHFEVFFLEWGIHAACAVITLYLGLFFFWFLKMIESMTQLWMEGSPPRHRTAWPWSPPKR